MKILDLEQSSASWLQWRRGGIGGSDASTLMSSSPFQTIVGLFEDKLSPSTGEFTENEHTARGKQLEPEARNLFNRLTGLNCQPLCIQSSTYDWMIGSVDGLDTLTNTLLEVKCPTEVNFEKWCVEGVPDYYVWQVRHYLTIMGQGTAYLMAYVSPTKYKVFHIPRDEEAEAQLIQKEVWFNRALELGVLGDIRRHRPQIISLCGYAGSGKDTLGSTIESIYSYTHVSYAEKLKELAQSLGLFNPKQKEKTRDNLVRLAGSQGIRGMDPLFWARVAFNGVDVSKGVVITDTRYLNEAEYARKIAEQNQMLHKLIWVHRDGVGARNAEELEYTSLLREVCTHTFDSNIESGSDAYIHNVWEVVCGN